MTVTLVGYGTASSGDNSSRTLGLAAGIAAGDISYAILGGKSATGTWATPAGWTLLFAVQSATAGCAMSVFARRYVGGDGSAGFTWGGGAAGNTTIGETFAIRGVPVGVPLADTFADWTLIRESAASNTFGVNPAVAYTSPDVWVGAGFWGSDVAEPTSPSIEFLNDPAFSPRFSTYSTQANNVATGTGAALPIGVASNSIDVASADFVIAVEHASGGGTHPVYAFAFRIGDKVYAGRADETDTAYALSGSTSPTRMAPEVDTAFDLAAFLDPAFHLGGLAAAYDLVPVDSTGAILGMTATVDGVAVAMSRITLRAEATTLTQGLDAVGAELALAAVGSDLVVTLTYALPDGTSSGVEVFSGTIDTVRAYERGLSQITASGVLVPHPPATITPTGKQYLTPGRVRAAADFFAQPRDTLDDGTLIGEVVTVAQAGRAWFTEYVNG